MTRPDVDTATGEDAQRRPEFADDGGNTGAIGYVTPTTNTKAAARSSGTMGLATSWPLPAPTGPPLWVPKTPRRPAITFSVPIGGNASPLGKELRACATTPGLEETDVIEIFNTLDHAIANRPDAYYP